MSAKFDKAWTEHLVLKRLAAQDADFARNLWDGITGRDTAPGSIGEALADTMPGEIALLLADDVPAVFALSTAWGMMRHFGPTDSPHDMREAARECWEVFSARANVTAELTQSLGWASGDDLAWTTMQDTNTDKGDLEMIRRVARLAGRMYSVLKGSAVRKVPGMSGEIYSVEQGNAIARLLPFELACLADSAVELLALERIATKRASQFAVRGEAPQSRGPLVVALDESGSMNGGRNEWAKAAALAVARVAAEDNRPVSIVHYSTSTRVQRLLPRDSKSVLEMIRTFLNGGTAIGVALDVAARQVEELARRGDHGADVILVTDGISHDTTAQTTALDKLSGMKARLYTVAIECEIAASSPLHARATSYSELGRAMLTESTSVSLLAKAA